MTAITFRQTAEARHEPASILPAWWPFALLGALLLGVLLFFYLLATGYFFVTQAAGQKPGQTAPVKPRRAILTHMGTAMDYRTLCDELPAGVEPAYDGMVIEV